MGLRMSADVTRRDVSLAGEFRRNCPCVSLPNVKLSAH